MSYKYANELSELLNQTSANKLAKQMGFSPSALSQYLKGDYNGNIENLESKISAYIERQKERAAHWDMGVVQTKTLAEMLVTIQTVHTLRAIGMIYGPAGIGKTCATLEYIKNTPGCIRITGVPDSKSVKGVISLLYEAIFGSDLRGSARNGRLKVLDHLQGRDLMVVVDEAHELTNEAIEELRGIHDASKCAMILIGTDEIFSRLTDRRAGRILQQLDSRISVRRQFGSAEILNDLNLICDEYDVFDKGVRSTLARYLQMGGLRRAVDQLKVARLIAAGKTIDMDILKMAQNITENNKRAA